MHALLGSVNSTYTSIVTSVFSSTIAAKVWFASAAFALAIVQVSTGARIFGKLQHVIPLSSRVVSPIHRWSGRAAILLTLPVGFHCIFILGFQTYDTRVLVHSLVGSFVYGVIVVKLLMVRSHRYPGWALPVAGGTLFAVLTMLWITSAAWYFTNVRVGF
jgi:Family of unknown function (DUF6529)